MRRWRRLGEIRTKQTNDKQLRQIVIRQGNSLDEPKIRRAISPAATLHRQAINRNFSSTARQN